MDPDSDESKAALQNKQKQAADLDTQKKTLMQQAFGLEQMRIAFEKYRHDSETQFKYFAEVLDVEVEEAKIVGAATVDIAKARRVADEQSGNETTGNGAAGQPTAADDPGAAA